MKWNSRLLAIAAVAASSCASGDGHRAVPAATMPSAFDLGAFSVSLSVRDLAASRAFYAKLGFAPVAGDGRSWQILRNGDCNLGLFQGMFEGNLLTFNPGWSHTAEPLARFTDVRELQRRLEAQGVALATRADPASTGPASFTLQDPDGNVILVDQHVPAR
jgi:catechol 2,3-dioxygenase-like lactoylglutathione lyase family enzyme